MTGARPVTVLEFTDPACVWSWGAEAKFRWLRERTGERVRWRRVFGVAHDDVGSLREHFDPVADAPFFRDGWARVAGQTGAPASLEVAWVHRSTRPVATAAKAAERQGPDVADRVLRRLREAVFVFGRPPDTPERIADAVRDVPGLDRERLLADTGSAAVADLVAEDVERARHPRPEVFDLAEPQPYPGAAKPDDGRWRYAFPTIVIEGSGGTAVVPGWRPLDDYLRAFDEVAPETRISRGPTTTADEALERYRTLSRAELTLLTGSEAAPAAAHPFPTVNGPFYLHPDEASASLVGVHSTRVQEAL